MDFSTEELTRYGRQIILPQFGETSQQKLKQAKVLVIGAGGLGSPALLYLAAAGIGTIGIVEFDTIDLSNLHRQVLYTTDQTEHSTCEKAKERLLALNPNIQINLHPVALDRNNALAIISNYDVIADGTDNFATRYLVNDACVILKKTNVYASVFQYEGQVSVFNYPLDDVTFSPNYRDLFPEPPDFALNCAEGGVLGVLPGIIGSMQALEVIKIITGIGEPLVGKLFCFDALTFQSKIIQYKKNGNQPPITELMTDYPAFCGIKPTHEITIAEFLRESDYQLIDVRTPEEYAEVNMKGLLIPLDQLEKDIHRISREKKIIIHCKSGARSAQAVEILKNRYGFQNVFSLKGGILAYMAQRD
jgi:adenylyltransferase/sulfurtransferase